MEVMYGDLPLTVCCETLELIGSERFREVTNMFYRHASICFVVYDIANTDSFQSVVRDTG